MKRKLTALLLMLLCALPGLFAQTRAELLKKAQAGDAGAQHDLAYCYHWGKLSYLGGELGETSPDYDEAEKWYLRAAEQKHYPACYALGLLYQNQKRDIEKAVRWYKKSVDICYEKYGEIDKYSMEELKKLGIDYTPGAKGISYASSSASNSSDNFGFEPINVARPNQNGSSHFDLKRDERVVENYIAQSNSHAAATYLKKLFENDQYPEDADEMFGYACLIQKLLVQIGNEGAQAVASMDLMSSMTITIDQQNMNNLHIALLFLAANKGHRGAYQLLQLKAAMQGGGGANFQPSNSGSSGSVVGSKTCSLCHGRGWIAGSKTATYGNGGTYWCSECQSNVGASHSHDRCPSCGGRGTVPTIK